MKQKGQRVGPEVPDRAQQRGKQAEKQRHAPARAQQHAAEVAGDHHDQVGQTAVLQYLQRRGARRFGRFAVVGIALPVAFPQAVGVYIVPGSAVGCADLLQKRHCSFLAVGKGQRRDKAALFFFVFSGGRAPDGAVILHVGSSCVIFELSIT